MPLHPVPQSLEVIGKELGHGRFPFLKSG